MECISRPAFSVIINGKPCGFFNSNRGLRQRCPLSPYLFCIIMEFFSALLNPKPEIVPTSNIKGDTSKSHLLFADDVMIFTKASMEVAVTIKSILEDFRSLSGLNINCANRFIFYSICGMQVKHEIMSTLNFKQSNFPTTYLGLPLFTSSVSFHDCNPIIEKIRKRLAEWKSKNPFFCGEGGTH